jgi:hypothetical protein
MIERWSSVWELCVSEFVRFLASFDVCLLEAVRLVLLMLALQDILLLVEIRR